MPSVALPRSALLCYSRGRALLCLASLCQTSSSTGVVDIVLWYACTAGLPAALLQSASCSAMIGVTLPDSAPDGAVLHSASLCQTPRCASTVCIVLCYALSRSARYRAKLARSTVCSGMPCYALRRPDRHRAVQTQSTVRSAMLCSALLCRTSPRTGAVGCSAELPPELAQSEAVLRSDVLCVALPGSALCKRSLHRAMQISASFCQTPRCASAVDSALCYALRLSARLRATLAKSAECSAMLCIPLCEFAPHWRSRQQHA